MPQQTDRVLQYGGYKQTGKHQQQESHQLLKVKIN